MLKFLQINAYNFQDYYISTHKEGAVKHWSLSVCLSRKIEFSGLVTFSAAVINRQKYVIFAGY